MRRKLFCAVLATLLALSVYSSLQVKRQQREVTQEVLSQMRYNLMLLFQCTETFHEQTEENAYFGGDISFVEERLAVLVSNLQIYSTLYPKDYLGLNDLSADCLTALQSLRYGTEETQKKALRSLLALVEYMRLYTDDMALPKRKEFLEMNETAKQAMEEGNYDQLHHDIMTLH